jgi:hypothetical protein
MAGIYMPAEKERSDPKPTIEERIAAIRRIDVSLPSESERDAAFRHLFVRAEALVSASRVAKEMQGAKVVRAQREVHRDHHDHKRHILLAKLLRQAGELSREDYILQPAKERFTCMKSDYRKGSANRI